MPARGSSEVGQRRFWNMLDLSPGIMYIGSWSYSPYAILRSNTGFEEPLTVFENGPIPFPPQHKFATQWWIDYERWVPGLAGVDFDGTNEWIFKPYSTDFRLVGSNAWQRGEDWDTANLFYDASPFAIPTTLHYEAYGNTPATGNLDIAPEWVYNPGSGAQGFGAGGLLYGYLNDHYFGNNEMGGNKPNEGVGPKTEAVGDLSKSYPGFWGALGISHGTCINADGCFTKAQWLFNLCARPQQYAMFNFNNQMSHLHEGGEFQSEGWGTDVVAIHDATIEKEDGSQETYRQFTVNVSPARSTGTLNVYTVKGLQLEYGIDYVHDDCDKSGRSYRLLLSDKTAPGPGGCDEIYVLVVTYLVSAPSLRAARHPGRVTDTNVDANRRDPHDIRGL